MSDLYQNACVAIVVVAGAVVVVMAAALVVSTIARMIWDVFTRENAALRTDHGIPRTRVNAEIPTVAAGNYYFKTEPAAQDAGVPEEIVGAAIKHLCGCPPHSNFKVIGAKANDEESIMTYECGRCKKIFDVSEKLKKP